jgi:hypothetical protein
MPLRQSTTVPKTSKVRALMSPRSAMRRPYICRSGVAIPSAAAAA